MMKKLSIILFACLLAPSLGAQTASLLVPQQSKYGYPWTVLAGSDRKAYVTPIAETDPITAWKGDGNMVIFSERITSSLAMS